MGNVISVIAPLLILTTVTIATQSGRADVKCEKIRIQLKCCVPKAPDLATNYWACESHRSFAMKNGWCDDTHTFGNGCEPTDSILGADAHHDAGVKPDRDDQCITFGSEEGGAPCSIAYPVTTVKDPPIDK